MPTHILSSHPLELQKATSPSLRKSKNTKCPNALTNIAMPYVWQTISAATSKPISEQHSCTVLFSYLTSTQVCTKWFFTTPKLYQSITVISLSKHPLAQIRFERSSARGRWIRTLQHRVRGIKQFIDQEIPPIAYYH